MAGDGGVDARGWHAVLATSGGTGPRHSIVGGVDVVDVTHPASLALVLEDTSQPVLVVSHREHAQMAATAAGVLQGHRPDLVVGHTAALAAPVALLAALQVAREHGADAGRGAATWHALLERTWSGCVLSSVAGLDSPNPTVLQHLRSWWPPSRFLVRLHPGPAAVSVGRARLLLDVPRGGTDAVLSESAVGNRTIEDLLSAASPVSVRPVPLPGRWDDVLSRPDLGQLALLPSDVADLAPRPDGVCPGCGQSTAAPVCLFCRVRLTDDDRAHRRLVDVADLGRGSDEVGQDFHEIFAVPGPGAGQA